MDSNDNYGCLCHDFMARSLLTYTSIQDLDMSLEMILYGQVIKDHHPVLQDKYQIHTAGIERQRWPKGMKSVMLQHSCPLQELEIVKSVQIQNQAGPYPHQWAKTGRIVEALCNRQYHVRIDVSNWVTQCNRCFLQERNPVMDTLYHPIQEAVLQILDTSGDPMDSPHMLAQIELPA